MTLLCNPSMPARISSVPEPISRRPTALPAIPSTQLVHRGVQLRQVGVQGRPPVQPLDQRVDAVVQVVHRSPRLVDVRVASSGTLPAGRLADCTIRTPGIAMIWWVIRSMAISPAGLRRS